MDEQKAKRTRRTPQQVADEIEAKIQKLNQDIEVLETKRAAANAEFDSKVVAVKDRIAALEQKKEDTLKPKQPRKHRKSKKQKIQDLITMASKSGLKPEEIAERLGFGPSEEE